METGYLVSAAVLATLFCLAILVTALLWRRDRVVEGRRRNRRLFLIVGAVMTPLGVIETLLFWWRDMPLAIPLPMVFIGLLFLVIGLANTGRGQGGQRGSGAG